MALAAFARETLFRAAQEGLTNVQKHGKEVTHITVCLEYTPEAVELTIKDNGHKPDLTGLPQPGGFGLTGLRERLEQLGGTLHSGAGGEHGFEATARIPLQEAGHDRRPAG